MYRLSAIELRDAFQRGEFSATAIVEHFLNRIKTYDKELGCFLSVFTERALEKAALLDKRRLAGEKLGKLAGIPIAIKDNIHVKGEKTTCASKFLPNYDAIFDATATQLLEAEDAIIIGKTNLDEFAMGSSTENSALQKTRNPWDLSCVPGGSSGGSAAAVAARLCPLALGSDTGGSIRQPASFCGVTGFKPTYGRVSRYGLVAFGSSLDQIGPFANTAQDIALTMEILGQHCQRDSTSLPKESEEYLEMIEKPISRTKVGVPWSFITNLTEESKSSFMDSIELLKKEGCEIVDISLDMLKKSIATYYILSTAEASTNLARFDGIRYGHRSKEAKSLADVYDMSKEEGFGFEVKHRILLGTFVLSTGFQDAYYKKAQKVRTLIIDEFKRAFQQCEVIAMPTSPFAAFEFGEKKDPLQMYMADYYTIGANLAGLPAISVPSGFTQQRKPIGLQILASQCEDRRVCQFARAFEKVATPPTMIPEFVNRGEMIHE